MEIKVNLNLSKYSKYDLNKYVIEGVITVKEYYDELSERNTRNESSETKADKPTAKSM